MRLGGAERIRGKRGDGKMAPGWCWRAWERWEATPPRPVGAAVLLLFKEDGQPLSKNGRAALTVRDPEHVCRVGPGFEDPLNGLASSESHQDP